MSTSTDPPPFTIEYSCIQCQKPAKFMCSVCGPIVHYCSMECQRAHWPLHKTTCQSQSNTTGTQDTSIPLSHLNESHSVRNPTSSSSPIVQPTSSNQFNQRPRIPFRQLFQFNRNRSAVTTPEPETTLDTRTFQDKLEDLKFYSHQIYLIIKPVVCCILLSILWVKLTNPDPLPFDILSLQNDAFTRDPGTVGGGGGGISGSLPQVVPGSDDFMNSLTGALILMAQIVGVTILMLILFKYDCMRVFVGILFIIVLLLLGFFGYVLGVTLLAVFNAPLDYITFMLFLWNFGAVGVVSVFWKGLKIIQQAYLVVISSLMAFALTTIAPLTTWILLALLAIWDLIAVLCPFGPLKLLIDTARSNNREIPALLYSAMVWMAVEQVSSSDQDPSPDASTEQLRPTTSAIQGTDLGNNAVSRPERTTSLSPPPQAQTIPNEAQIPIQDATEQEEEEEEDRSGLKLGLGDFVFYSVLISRAALFDWPTTVSCTVAVLVGMNMTIFLLAIYGKALPALPISIAFGILFYFVSSIMMTPFISNQVLVSYVAVNGDIGQDSLAIGRVYGGMIYI